MNTRARIQTYDIAAASYHLEDILSLPFNSLELEDPDNGFSPGTPDHGPFPIAATPSTVEWEVDGSFPAPDTKRVTITIRTGGNTNSRKVFSYDFIKAKGYR